MPLGPAVIDPAGTILGEDDVRRLRHPAVGGVILFARNFESPEQLQALTRDIRALREPQLLIGVDHEGGRVQRFKEGFTALPPMRALGQLWDRDREAARAAARAAGYVIGAELAAHGLDFSFTPVLDLDYGASSVIGDRAFHYDPLAVAALGAELVRGLADGGMGDRRSARRRANPRWRTRDPGNACRPTIARSRRSCARIWCPTAPPSRRAWPG